MMQGIHHHHHNQLAAFLTAALPKDDAKPSSSSPTPEEDEPRLAALNSLHRAIIYPPNSLLVTHSASFLAQGFSQLLTDKSYSVRHAAATATATVYDSAQKSNSEPDQVTGSLKAELSAILPQIQEMRKRKSERKVQFIEVIEQIHRLKSEIYSSGDCASNDLAPDETDLSLRKLEELHKELQALQKEKSERLKQVMELLNYLYSLCSVLGLDFKQTVSEIHPSLCESETPRNISNETIQKLGIAIQKLREVKIQNMRKLQDLVTSLLELWNLLDTSVEEQQMFQKVTCNIGYHMFILAMEPLYHWIHYAFILRRLHRSAYCLGLNQLGMKILQGLF